MDIRIFDTEAAASQAAFELFKDTLKTGNETFGLATGSTPETLYALLSTSDLDFSQATAINLDEYLGLTADHPESYAYFMKEQLFNQKPFKSTFIPDGSNKDATQEIQRYNQVLADHPIDLQILGIGQNAHIGFNEPGSSFQAQTQLVNLTPSTIEANQRFFDSIDQVPKHAYSMGIKSIMQAKTILLLAFGHNKAEAVRAMIEGPVTEDVPASILQTHPNVKVYLDKEAAALLPTAK